MTEFSTKIITTPIYWLLKRAYARRMPMMRDNIMRAMPDTDNVENLIDKNFRHAANLVLEVLLLAVLPKNSIKNAVTFNAMADLDAELAAGNKVIVTVGHQANWEWTWLALGLRYPDYFLAGISRRQHSALANRFFNRIRSRFNNRSIEVSETTTDLKRRDQFPAILFIVADQSPPEAQAHRTVSFFDIDTPFQQVVEVYARRFKLPVYHLSQETTGFKQISCTLHQLYTPGETIGKSGIVQKFATQLERDIRTQPHTWLWAHNRWKHAKPKTK